MSVVGFLDWISEFSQPDVVWYVKRLAANDTLATGAHQAGPYIPREFLFGVFTSLNRPGEENPDVRFDLYVDSHANHRKARAVWYNNSLRGGTRNETRMTNLGGRASALLDPDSTGALTIFAFRREAEGVAGECHVWVCRNEVEEDMAEDRIGPVEPGRWSVWSPVHGLPLFAFTKPPPVAAGFRLASEYIPPDWLNDYPSGVEIVRKVVEMRPFAGLDPDERLLRRRACEYDIFLKIEEAVEMPVIRAGFDSIEEFVARAQSILQRRKTRAGRSLELHAREIFIEEGLEEGAGFSHGVDAEPGRKPDFLFPSQEHYRDAAFPAERLRMLAVKTTCKDRWRQILTEAARIRVKHLLTLQEGVSVNQFREMKDSGTRLVVPAGLRGSYPKDIRPELISLESFIRDARLLTADHVG